MLYGHMIKNKLTLKPNTTVMARIFDTYVYLSPVNVGVFCETPRIPQNVNRSAVFVVVFKCHYSLRSKGTVRYLSLVNVSIL